MALYFDETDLAVIFQFPKEKNATAIGYTQFITDDFKSNDDLLEEGKVWSLLWPTIPIQQPNRMKLLYERMAEKGSILKTKEVPAKILRVGDYEAMVSEHNQYLKTGSFQVPEKRVIIPKVIFSPDNGDDAQSKTKSRRGRNKISNKELDKSIANHQLQLLEKVKDSKTNKTSNKELDKSTANHQLQSLEKVKDSQTNKKSNDAGVNHKEDKESKDIVKNSSSKEKEAINPSKTSNDNDVQHKNLSDENESSNSDLLKADKKTNKRKDKHKDDNELKDINEITIDEENSNSDLLRADKKKKKKDKNKDKDNDKLKDNNEITIDEENSNSDLLRADKKKKKKDKNKEKDNDELQDNNSDNQKEGEDEISDLPGKKKKKKKDKDREKRKHEHVDVDVDVDVIEESKRKRSKSNELEIDENKDEAHVRGSGQDDEEPSTSLGNVFNDFACSFSLEDQKILRELIEERKAKNMKKELKKDKRLFKKKVEEELKKDRPDIVQLEMMYGNPADLDKLKIEKKETILLCDILEKLYTDEELEEFSLSGSGEGKVKFPFDVFYAICEWIKRKKNVKKLDYSRMIDSLCYKFNNAAKK